MGLLTYVIKSLKKNIKICDVNISQYAKEGLPNGHSLRNRVSPSLTRAKLRAIARQNIIMLSLNKIESYSEDKTVNESRDICLLKDSIFLTNNIYSLLYTNQTLNKIHFTYKKNNGRPYW